MFLTDFSRHELRRVRCEDVSAKAVRCVLASSSSHTSLLCRQLRWKRPDTDIADQASDSDDPGVGRCDADAIVLDIDMVTTSDVGRL